MLNEKNWVYNEIDERDIERLINETGVSRLVAKVLISRNIKDTDNIKRFLNPDIKDLHNPFLLVDMEKAVDRIIRAIDNKEKITLYGDYDVDGVTGTSILYSFLSELGGDVTFYIPDRLEEGYGVSRDALEALIKQGSNLIVTIDCGITAVDEAAYTRENKLDMIITDHHECAETLPDAYAVVNPCRPDCKYPFKELAGVGVVFKLINAICMKMGLGDLHLKYLDMVAIGTVADIVSLKDENRIIVKYGMEMIPRTLNIGLRALLNKSGLEGKLIGPYEIGFIIGPRINAAGRTGDAIKAVKMFITQDQNEASSIAQKLEEANSLRQEIEQTIYQQAVEIVETKINLNKEKVIVVAREGWHHGVIGIVASRITEKYYRPCILISIDENKGTGSGRSVEGFNLFAALNSCESFLEKYGGHELAAGLKLDARRINDFRQAINKYADRVLTEELLIPKIKIDAYINNEDINVESVEQLELLSPFGPGNPAPVFGYRDLKINEVRNVGADSKHLKLKLNSHGLQLDAIGFNMGHVAEFLRVNDTLDVAAKPELNCWNSTAKVQLNLRDIRKKQNIRDYYYSLDKCIGVECKYLQYLESKHSGVNTIEDIIEDIMKSTKKVLKDVIEIVEEKDLIKILGELLEQKKKTVVFVNSIVMTAELEKILEKFPRDIKKSHDICYTNFDDNKAELTMVINPIPENIDYMKFDVAIVAGRWLNPSCLSGVLNKTVHASKEIIFYKREGECNLEIDEIIPERDDLAVLYRYIRANCRNNLIIDDLFIFASEISEVYNVPMNYVKAKKGLEILCELGLLEMLPSGLYGALVKYDIERVKQVSLEDSFIFRNLQKLKMHLN
ncbi:MAG: single-stranded-DNA-specific exonuclease RecJ [Firmicutes bacterium]|nr:single-stranded-DNA-specific exonuclease RecJ [Bacillota bacterium]